MSIRLNYQQSALRVCLDSAEDGAFRGRILSLRLSAPINFFDITDFISQVDALLDVQKFPQAFQRIRSFTDKNSPHVPAVLSKEDMLSSEDVQAALGSAATFMLQIFSRQNASWQGAIDWLDGSERQRFSSTLELLKLVDNRLRQL